MGGVNLETCKPTISNLELQVKIKKPTYYEKPSRVCLSKKMETGIKELKIFEEINEKKILSDSRIPLSNRILSQHQTSSL